MLSLGGLSLHCMEFRCLSCSVSIPKKKINQAASKDRCFVGQVFIPQKNDSDSLRCIRFHI